MLGRLLFLLRLPPWEKRNALGYFWARLKTRLVYKWAFGSMGAGTVIWRPIMLQNTRFVHLGSKVVIRDGARFDLVAEHSGHRFTPEVRIGDGATFEQNFHLACASRVLIGPRVTMARNVSILDVSHSYQDITVPILDQPLAAAPISVGEGSLIGAGSVILPGVTIGRHCLIGANSVVNRDVPDFSVAAGAPARIIRRYDPGTGQWERVV